MTLCGERGAVALRLGSGWCWMDTGVLGGCRAMGWSIHILPAAGSWKMCQLKVLGAVITGYLRRLIPNKGSSQTPATECCHHPVLGSGASMQRV